MYQGFDSNKAALVTYLVLPLNFLPFLRNYETFFHKTMSPLDLPEPTKIGHIFRKVFLKNQ